MFAAQPPFEANRRLTLRSGWLLVARFVVGVGPGGELNTGLTPVAALMPLPRPGAPPWPQ